MATELSSALSVENRTDAPLFLLAGMLEVNGDIVATPADVVIVKALVVL